MAIGRFEYQAPGSLQEALSLLDRNKGRTSILAGGTDLIVQMKNGQTCPAIIVDVKRIPELNRLEWSEGEGLHIGAAICLSKLMRFFPVIEKFDILAQACAAIGSLQIRNRATLGGNLCNAAPSADTPPPLLCLGAKAVVSSRKGNRTIPMEHFFLYLPIYPIPPMQANSILGFLRVGQRSIHMGFSLMLDRRKGFPHSHLRQKCREATCQELFPMMSD